MPAIAHCYSTAGRTSSARFAVVAALTAAILLVISRVDWRSGVGINILAGAIGGAAVAKLLIEAIRRLRDAGIGRDRAAWAALGAGVASGGVFLIFLSSDPPWAETMLTVLAYALPLAGLMALGWPQTGTRIAGGGSARAGIAILIVSIVAGAAAMGFVAWLSTGMAANNRFTAGLEAAGERGSPLP